MDTGAAPCYQIRVSGVRGGLFLRFGPPVADTKPDPAERGDRIGMLSFSGDGSSAYRKAGLREPDGNEMGNRR